MELTFLFAFMSLDVWFFSSGTKQFDSKLTKLRSSEIPNDNSPQ